MQRNCNKLQSQNTKFSKSFDLETTLQLQQEVQDLILGDVVRLDGVVIGPIQEN